MKIFLTGGNGHLGKILVNHLQKDHDVFAPNSKECNILDVNNLSKIIKDFKPNIVIHLAALVDTFKCEEYKIDALDVNVLGTLNMVKACVCLDCKFVYVSSEYVFNGDKGQYTINDRLDPINVYGKTKAASEYITSILPNYQIIRVPFVRKIYPEVFTDQYCSRYFLDEAVEKISKNIFKNDKKIIHISSKRMSLHELYSKNNINSKPVLMSEEQKKKLPKDTSLVNNSI